MHISFYNIGRISPNEIIYNNQGLQNRCGLPNCSKEGKTKKYKHLKLRTEKIIISINGIF